jgi:hypothetical protein
MIILSILEDIFPPFSGFLGTLRRFDPCDKSKNTQTSKEQT